MSAKLEITYCDLKFKGVRDWFQRSHTGDQEEILRGHAFELLLAAERFLREHVPTLFATGITRLEAARSALRPTMTRSRPASGQVDPVSTNPPSDGCTSTARLFAQAAAER